MNCPDVTEKLGTYLDGELSAQDAEAVHAHLAECEGCRTQFDELQALVEPLQASRSAKAPPELWDAIEVRLDAEEPVTIPIPAARAEPGDRGVDVVTPTGGRTGSRRRIRPFLMAAAVLLPIGLAAFFLHLSSSQPAYAEEAVIDFRPLLAGIETDYDAAMADFLAHHKAQPMGLTEAGQHLHVRVHPRDPMPEGLVLKETHLLTLGKKRGLFFQFSGPQGKLVISQCPVGVKKQHGEHHCLPCQIGSRPNAEAVLVGSWRLVHLPSEKGCICILSTIHQDDDLARILEALQIEF
jgi:anti-sigma factor (TIGR02949 family)